MATEKQTEFFRAVHQAERDRTQSLRDIAKTYIGLSSIYTAFIIFVSSHAIPFGWLAKGVFAAILITMMLSFLYALRVIHVSTYEGLANLSDIIRNFGSSRPVDEEFFDDRLADYAVSCEKNRKVNDRKATLLSKSGYLLLSGLTLHAIFFLIWLFDAKGAGGGQS